MKSHVHHGNSVAHADSPTIQETPPRPAATPSALEVKPANLAFTDKGSGSTIVTNPVKTRNTVPSFYVEVNTAVSMTPEKSIYDHLGWDDEDDELALP